MIILIALLNKIAEMKNLIEPLSLKGYSFTVNNEKAIIDNNCEIRLGVASWDEGDNLSKSVKFTWFDKSRRAA